MAIFRTTGVVTEVGAREGLIKNGPKAGEPYSIPFIVVAMNDFVMNTLNLPDHLVGKFSQGELVDLIVDVSLSGSFVRTQVMNLWPKDGIAVSAKSPAPRSLASTGS